MRKVCVVCGGEFEAVMADGRTAARVVVCSSACRHARRLKTLKLWRERRRSPRPCAVCGKLVNRGGKALTCSDDCGRAMRAAKAKRTNRLGYLRNRKARLDACRKWRAENADRVKENSRRYAEANAEMIKERRRRYLEARGEDARERDRARSRAKTVSHRLVQELLSKGLEVLL